MADVEVETLQIKSRNWSTFQKIKERSSQVDFVFVPSFRHKDIAFVKLASNAPVIFDPLISKYMTKVLDYRVKWKAPHKYLVDWLAFRWPDALIWDTEVHQEYLRKKYRLNKPMNPIYIGVDTDLFFPIEKQETEKIVVGFYGSFNPLQGIDKIVRAAHLLRNKQNIEFQIIGSGSTYKKVRKLATELKTTNITFMPNVPYDKLNHAINQFDICLGVFGESLKTDVVIPNKIYHYAAAKKCIITKDTPAIRELFEDDIHLHLVQNRPEHIAESIETLYNKRESMNRLAQNAFDLITKNYNQDKIAEMFVNFLKSCS